MLKSGSAFWQGGHRMGQGKNRMTKHLSLILDRQFNWSLYLITSLAWILVNACNFQTTAPTLPSSPMPLAKELIFYDWEEDMPQSVIDIFTKEFGVRIEYLVYESQEEAIANMRAGQVYDVVVMDSRFIPRLAKERLLSSLDHKNLPNLRNISANFRELAYDPNNQYSVPYNWGTTGLVVRTDLVKGPITSWRDLWDTRYAGQVGLWMGQPREVIGLTLKSLGYSANSENPQELEAALGRLLELKPNVVPLENYDLNNSVDAMTSGKIVLSMGYAGDVVAGRELNPSIVYILPREGGLMWNDTFIIPANSANSYTAELFLNFLLRPEINAMIANENLYATPNEAAYPFIKPDILHDPVIFPSNNDLINAELILPLTEKGQELYDEIWQKFDSSP